MAKDVNVDSLGNVECDDSICFKWMEALLTCEGCPIAHLLNIRFAYYNCKEKRIEYDSHKQGEQGLVTEPV